MREIGLPFKGNMVRQIIARRKWKTRRVVKLNSYLKQLKGDLSKAFVDHGRAFANGDYLHVPCPVVYDETTGEIIHDDTVQRLFCPYGDPPIRREGGSIADIEGNEEVVFYVREAWWDFGKWIPNYIPGEYADTAHWQSAFEEPFYSGKIKPLYAADYEHETPGTLFDAVGNKWDVDENKHRESRGELHWRKKPSIFLPKRLSRIRMPLESVRVERLQDITSEDIEAEGFELPPDEMFPHVNREDKLKAGFSKGWNEINGKRPGCSWRENPWVWVLSWDPENVEVKA